MAIAIDTESNVELERQLAQAEADITRMMAKIMRFRTALEGALVILESMPRPSAGLVSNNVQAAFDRRLVAVHAALKD